MDLSAKKKKILLVEDEVHLGFTLRLNLETEGYEVVHVVSGSDAVEVFKLAKKEPASAFDLIILDLMLPDLDGIEVAKKIREFSKSILILMLTARSNEQDKIEAFEAEVDDYLTKPFSMKELMLRLKRLFARSWQEEAKEKLEPLESIQKLVVGGYILDLSTLFISSKLGKFPITSLESFILKEFFLNPNKVLSREYLLRKVWGLNGKMETRTVDNFIVRLRKYLECDPSNPQMLKSIRGKGYLFSPKENESHEV